MGGGPGGATSRGARLRELTGRPGGPSPELPPGLLPGLGRLARSVGRHSAAVGVRVEVDPVAVACERAGIAGLARRGTVSCGGACRLLPADGGWVAVSLTRPDDWVSTAAWLGLEAPVGPGRWDEVADHVAGRAAADLVERAVLLGMAVASVGERARAGRVAGTDEDTVPGVTVSALGDAAPTVSGRPLTVVDLSTLWAGPLAASLVRRAGAQVVKVESSTRPDGARSGPPAFFRSLNGGKVPVTLDLSSAAGRRALGDLVDRADVVVTSARPRALVQLGLDPFARVAAGGPRVWLAVTGYGAGPVRPTGWRSATTPRRPGPGRPRRRRPVLLRRRPGRSGHGPGRRGGHARRPGRRDPGRRGGLPGRRGRGAGMSGAGRPGRGRRGRPGRPALRRRRIWPSVPGSPRIRGTRS